MRKSSSAASTASSSVPSLCSIPTSQQPPPEVMNSDLEIPEVTAQTPCGTVFNWEDLMQVNWKFKGFFAKYVIRNNLHTVFLSLMKIQPLHRLLMESCKSSALMASWPLIKKGSLSYVRCFDMRPLFLQSHLNFAVSLKKNCPILVSVYDKQGDLEIYSEFFGW